MTTADASSRPGGALIADRGAPDPPQYSVARILVVWLAAAVPMAVGAWLVAPAIDGRLDPDPTIGMFKALVVVLTAGLIWQFIVVAVALAVERRRSSAWRGVREALWLQRPRTANRTGGRLWWIVVPLILGLGLQEAIPSISHAANRDFAQFLTSDTGESFLNGNWPWFALVVVMALFNTVLGEELLFRGLLLPRMNAAFGKYDWIANGVLFAAYHLHTPWVIPSALLDTFLLAWPVKHFRSAWLGIIVHSAQSVFVIGAVLAVVLGS